MDVLDKDGRTLTLFSLKKINSGPLVRNHFRARLFSQRIIFTRGHCKNPSIERSSLIHFFFISQLFTQPSFNLFLEIVFIYLV